MARGRGARPRARGAPADGAWLVICEAHDRPALWAYRGLLRRGLRPLELVSAEALSCALEWEHTIDAGGARTEARLADGRTLRSDEIRGVLNRLVSVPEGPAALAGADREYAGQEVTAFFMSWLHALPGPVLNPPGPDGLCGPWLHPSEWALLAHEAGLATAPYRLGSGPGGGAPADARPAAGRRRCIVVGRRAISGDAPAGVRSACRRLAEAVASPLLCVELDALDGWAFAGAATVFDLRLGGPALLDELALALGGPGGGP